MVDLFHSHSTKAASQTKPGPKQVTPVITDGMSESEIRAAGLAVDVPFESGEAKPERLSYADLGEGKRYSGEVPAPGKAKTTEDTDGTETTSSDPGAA